jgi:uncharacterized membrane protein
MVSLDPKAGKWVLALLVVSLALNLFIGGIIVGQRLHHHGPRLDVARERADSDRRVFTFLDRMAGILPPDDRKQFLTVIDTYRGELGHADSGVREAREKVRTAIAADPFDRNALEQAFEQTSVRWAEMSKVLHAAMADAISHLSPEGRKALAAFDPNARDRGPPPPPPPGQADTDKDR